MTDIKLNRTDKSIISYLTEHGETAIWKLASRVGVSLDTVNKSVNKLLEAGIIKEIITDDVRLGINNDA